MGLLEEGMWGQSKVVDRKNRMVDTGTKNEGKQGNGKRGNGKQGNGKQGNGKWSREVEKSYNKFPQLIDNKFRINGSTHTNCWLWKSDRAREKEEENEREEENETERGRE